jgi:hypothetical protein
MTRARCAGLFLLSLWLFTSSNQSIAAPESARKAILDQYTPTQAQLAEWANSYDVMLQFSLTREFAGKHNLKKSDAFRTRLSNACGTPHLADCQAFLRANRRNIRDSLPDSSLYWKRFWAVIHQPNIFKLHDDPEETLAGIQALLEASAWWFYKDLADDGRIEIDRAIQVYRAGQHWSTGHQTLLLRTVGCALQGFATRQLSYALAQARSDHDLMQLGKLDALVQPPELTALAWGPVLWIERETQRAYQSQQPPDTDAERNAARNEALGIIGEPEISMLLDQPEQYITQVYDLLAAHYIPRSIASWDDYWSTGIPPPSPDTFAGFELATAAAPSYAPYIASERTAHFHTFPLRALIEIYAGRSAPGIPAMPPPKHWHWVWQTEPNQQLCLASDAIHPTTRGLGYRLPKRVCAEYYDAKLLKRLAPNQ